MSTELAVTGEVQQVPPVTALAIPEPVQAPRASLRETLSILSETQLMEAFGRELVQQEVAALLFDQDERLARMFARSGYFSDIKGATPMEAISQAMTKIQLGRSWNMAPADAVKFVYFVNGKPAVETEYLGSKMRDAGLDWKIQWHRDTQGVCIGCTLWPERLQTGGGYKPIMEIQEKDGKLIEVPASVTFGKAQADRIKVKQGNGWISLSEKDTYQYYPEDLYYTKCVSRLRKRYCPNVLSGIMTKDEAEEVTVEMPKALPAPKAPMEISGEDMRPTRQRASRAGKSDIPGTTGADQSTPTKADVVPVNDAPAQEAPEIPDTPASDAPPEPKEAPVEQKQEPTPAPATEPAQPTADQKEKDNWIAQIKAIGVSRGESVYVQQLYSISSRITPETLSTFAVPQLKDIYTRLTNMKPPEPQQEGGNKRKLF